MDPVSDAAILTTFSVGLDTVWVLFSAFLVFFMNLGFAMVETGLCRNRGGSPHRKNR